MNLIQALKNQFDNNIEDVKEVLKEMIEDVINGADVCEILESYGLEPDYSIDLIILASKYESI